MKAGSWPGFRASEKGAGQAQPASTPTRPHPTTYGYDLATRTRTRRHHHHHHHSSGRACRLRYCGRAATRTATATGGEPRAAVGGQAMVAPEGVGVGGGPSRWPAPEEVRRVGGIVRVRQRGADSHGGLRGCSLWGFRCRGRVDFATSRGSRGQGGVSRIGIVGCPHAVRVLLPGNGHR